MLFPESVTEEGSSSTEGQMRSAFESFFRKSHKRVRSTVIGILWKVDFDSVDEVVNTTFSRVYEALLKGEHVLGPSSVAFVVTAARNRALDVLRYINVRNAVPFDDDRHPAGVPDESLDELMSKAQRLDFFRQILLQLEAKHRNVLGLILLDGLSHQEAADKLGIPVGTFYVYVHRAKIALRRHLLETGIPPEDWL